MKKTILIFGLLFSISISFAQVEQSWEGLKKDLEDSNEDIQHDKKKLKDKTWQSRSQLMYDIYTFNTAGLSIGMNAEEGIFSLKTVEGEPLKKEKTEDGGFVWVYPHKKVYVKNGIVQSWEETEYITDDALVKAYDALLKADELDEKKKLREKTDFQTLAMQIRTALVNKAIGYYEDKDYEPAYQYMEKGLKLAEFPKLETDTNYTVDVLHYYLGIIAIGAELYDEAKDHFASSIRLNYNPGMSYHYLAEAYGGEGDDEKYIEKIKEGFEKYPNEEQLVIDLINYYIKQEQPDKVIEYIDYAIQKNPENPSYYSAKATIYDNRDETYYEEYIQMMDSVHEYKKKAFQNRFDAKKKEMFQNKQKEAEDKAAELQAQSNDYFKKADALYEQALQTDPSFFNAAFNRGRLYYKRHERKAAEADIIFKIYKDGPRADKIEEEIEPSLRKAAEYFEQAHKANPKDINTVDILRSIYFKLRDEEKKEKYLKILNELKAETKEGGM